MATSRRVIASVNHTYARQGTRPMSQPNCDLVEVFVPAVRDPRWMKLGYGEGGAGTEVGSSMVPRARV
jgi:hypothetical protein